MLLHEACCYLLTSVHRPDLHRLRRAVAEVQPHLHEQGGQLHREVRARGRARLRWRPARRRTALIGREDRRMGDHAGRARLDRCLALCGLAPPPPPPLAAARSRPACLGSHGLGVHALESGAWAGAQQEHERRADSHRRREHPLHAAPWAGLLRLLLAGNGSALLWGNFRRGATKFLDQRLAVEERRRRLQARAQATNATFRGTRVPSRGEGQHRSERSHC
mmetsp:Transcript_123320/g.356370  ORF Transcript_123320/g.356370 Transcript_123320/m.356370 type:complete len:221 (-) Transcript_123320:50-712(-)